MLSDIDYGCDWLFCSLFVFGVFRLDVVVCLLLVVVMLGGVGGYCGLWWVSGVSCGFWCVVVWCDVCLIVSLAVVGFDLVHCRLDVGSGWYLWFGICLGTLVECELWLVFGCLGYVWCLYVVGLRLVVLFYLFGCFGLRLGIMLV